MGLHLRSFILGVPRVGEVPCWRTSPLPICGLKCGSPGQGSGSLSSFSDSNPDSDPNTTGYRTKRTIRSAITGELQPFGNPPECGVVHARLAWDGLADVPVSVVVLLARAIVQVVVVFRLLIHVVEVFSLLLVVVVRAQELESGLVRRQVPWCRGRGRGRGRYGSWRRTWWRQGRWQQLQTLKQKHQVLCLPLTQLVD